MVFLEEDPELFVVMSGALQLGPGIVMEPVLPHFPRTVDDSNNTVNSKRFSTGLDSDISNLPSLNNV